MFPKKAAMQENNGIKTDWLLVQIFFQTNPVAMLE